MWSFVFKKDNKRWIWTAISRKTRQIVAFVIGDRSEKTCRRLWQRLPAEYRELHSFSDFWEAYKKAFPKETHRSVGKEMGETAHMERWYNTLRQQLVEKPIWLSTPIVGYQSVYLFVNHSRNVSVSIFMMGQLVIPPLQCSSLLGDHANVEKQPPSATKATPALISPLPAHIWAQNAVE